MLGAFVGIVLSLLIFLLVQIVVVDLAEEVLQAGLSSPTVSVVVGLNYVTWIYVVVIVASTFAANIVFHGPRSIIASLLAAVCTVSLLYLISMVGFTAAYPNITLNLTGILSAPTLYLCYVVRDIFTFQLIVLAIQVAFFVALDALLLREP